VYAAAGNAIVHHLDGEHRTDDRCGSRRPRSRRHRILRPGGPRRLTTAPNHHRLEPSVDATSAQVALAWLLAQGDDIAPIPGTERVSRVEENTAGDGIELSADQIQRLNDLTPAAGERHDEANMAAVDR
jgi:aryl-alcohol dehydrogenase-like predicted oxidoreductase